MIENPPLKRDKIMAVDDHPANLKLLEDMLRQRGYQVHCFPRGRLALAAAAKDPPDLILLDVNMPEMNGYEVCERLRADEKLSRIPVIFLSALNEPTDKVKAFRSGPETTELHELFELSRRRLLSIIDDALLLTQIEVEGESFAPTPVSLSAALTRAVDEASELARSRQVTIELPPADLGLVLGVEDLLVRASRALLETAVKFSTAGEAVGLRFQAASDSVCVVIDSHGLVIPVPLLATFFELFSISEASTPGGDLGLGAPAASRILSLFGGSISVENRERPGIRLTVRIKTAQPRTAWTPLFDALLMPS